MHLILFALSNHVKQFSDMVLTTEKLVKINISFFAYLLQLNLETWTSADVKQKAIS